MAWTGTFLGITPQVIVTFTSVVVALSVYDYTRKKAKSDLTIDIWKVWSGKEMRIARSTIGGRFHVDAASEARTKYVQISYDDVVQRDDKITTAELALLYANVAHFLIEIGSLKAKGFLNDALFSSLFRRALLHWKARFHSVRYSQESRLVEHRETYRDLREAFDILLPEEANFGPPEA